MTRSVLHRRRTDRRALRLARMLAELDARGRAPVATRRTAARVSLARAGS